MKCSATPWNDPRNFQLGVQCPYFNSEKSICDASFSRMNVKRARKKLYCQAEEYDSCALYLSKMLRHSQSKNAGHGVHDLFCK